MDGLALDSGIVIDGRYRIEGRIGEGGMATVYRVRHLALGSVHALKVLSVSSRSIRDRMRQEGQFQAKLSHPNIVAVTDVIELQGETPGLIMEYVDGPTLERLLETGPLSLAIADEIATGIFAGVAEAHRHGVVHRDLKPSNVLLKPVGKGYLAKVTDFGLAKATAGTEGGRSRTRTGTSMGTPHYMSPEQVRDAKYVAPTSDIFALGAILYEMVTGVRAFDGADLLEVYNAVAHARYEPVQVRMKGLPPRMERAIIAALQVEPSRRPQSVEALAALWLDREVEAPPPPASPLLGPPVSRGSTHSGRKSGVARPDSIDLRSSHDPVLWAVGGGLMISVVAALVAATAAAAGAWWYLSRTPATASRTQPPPSVVMDTPFPILSEPLVPIVDTPPDGVSLAPEDETDLPPAEDVQPSPPPPAPSLATIEQLAKSLKPKERRVAIAHMGDRTDPEVLALLERLVRDGDPTVRSAAWKGVVSRYESSRGALLQDTVVRMAGEGTPLEAQEATKALGRWAKSPKLLISPLDHPNNQVRAAAVDVLPAVVSRAGEDAELGPIRKRLRNEKDRYVIARIERLPANLRPN